MLHSLLVVILTALITCLALALIYAALRPRRQDVMPRAVNDAPRFVRGGYASIPGSGIPRIPR